MIILLQDKANSKAEILVENTIDGGKKMFISGNFLMFNKPNRNKRVYPEKIMDAAVNQYRKDYIEKNRALGEMNHPPGRLSVDPERACIMTTELNKDGNYYHGKAKVLSTPLGNVLKALLEDGVNVGVSSRGVGSLTSRGPHKEVGNDFSISTAADIVFDPSVADAFVEHLMEEKEYILVGGQYLEKDMFQSKLNILKAPSIHLQEAKLKAFNDFLSKIKS